MTIESLQAFGADTKAGLARCINREDLYLRLVKMFLQEDRFTGLQKAMESGDGKAVFEAAHAMKGVIGNLSLTPLEGPVGELTELFRNAGPVEGERKEKGERYLAQILELGEKLKEMAAQ